MIRQSYIFLPGINKKSEQNLWKQGITDWDSFLNKQNIEGLSKARKFYYDRHLLKAKRALYNQDVDYFHNSGEGVDGSKLDMIKWQKRLR